MSLAMVDNKGRQSRTQNVNEQTSVVFLSSDLKRRLEKLSRHYDVETMKVFMVVEAIGESRMHAVYSPLHKTRWQPFLQRHEACRIDNSKHEKTRHHYQNFLKEVGREDQGRQWFLAVLRLLHRYGAADTFQYLATHASSSTNGYQEHSQQRLPHHHHHHHHHHHQYRQSNNNSPRRYELLPLGHGPLSDTKHARGEFENGYSHGQKALDSHRSVVNIPKPLDPGGSGNIVDSHPANRNTGSHTGGPEREFCNHLVRLFEKKLDTWFDSFQAVAVRLTAHVKVSGLVRVLSGQVHALVTRKGRLTALVVKVTQQETPRPLDVAELCLNKVMVIQNGLAAPEDLGLALLVLHVHPARPVLRLWQFTPSPEMESAIRAADIDDMIDAGRLPQHELWAETTTVDPLPLADPNPAPAFGRDDPSHGGHDKDAEDLSMIVSAD